MKIASASIFAFCCVEVQSRSWTAIVDASIYESSNKDVARVLYATEQDLFPIQTAIPTVSPSTSSSRFRPDRPDHLSAQNATLSPSTSAPTTAKHPNQLPALDPSQLPWLLNASSDLHTGAPNLSPRQPPGLNTSHAPTSHYANITVNQACHESASLYRVVVFENGGSVGINTTLFISVLTSSTKYVSQRVPVRNETATSRRTSNKTNVLHRPTFSNIFGRTSPNSPKKISGTFLSIAINNTENSTLLVDARNITVGIAKRYVVGNFTIQSSNRTGLKTSTSICLEPHTCYEVTVRGGTEGIHWAIQAVEEGVANTALRNLSSVAIGKGDPGFRCTFHTPNSNGSHVLQSPCPNSCNATQPNSASADSSTRPTTPTPSSFPPTTTLTPSKSMYPSSTGAILTGQPGSLSQLPPQTMNPTSAAKPAVEPPSRSPSKLEPTQAPSHQRHLTHHPTDFTEVGPPVDVKTPFPTFQGK